MLSEHTYRKNIPLAVQVLNREILANISMVFDRFHKELDKVDLLVKDPLCATSTIYKTSHLFKPPT